MAEDNLPDALLVREAIRMEELPIEVHLAQDGRRAIEFIVRAEQDESAPRPQILLLDLNLPMVDGFEVLRRLRASPRLAAIPVLIMTSSDAPNDRSQAAALGAEYFRKSPSYEEFLKLGPTLKRLLQENGLI